MGFETSQDAQDMMALGEEAPAALSVSTQSRLMQIAKAAGFRSVDELVLEALELWIRDRQGGCAAERLRREGGGCPSSSGWGVAAQASAETARAETAEAAEARWAALPRDVFLHVYASLAGSPSALASGRLLCRAWAAGLGACSAHLAPTRPTYGPRYVQKPFAGVLPGLRSLDLLGHPHFGRRPEDLAALGGLTALTSLSFRWWGELAPTQVAELNALPALARLRLVFKTEVAPASLSALADLRPKLELEWVLPDVEDRSVPAADIAALQVVPSLARLVVHASAGFFDDSCALDGLGDKLSALGALAPLRCLRLARRNAGGSQLGALRTLAWLQVLDLSECYNLHQGALTALQPLTSLRWLSLSAPGYEEPPAEPFELLRHLTLLTALTHLDLTGRVSPASDSDVAHLEALPWLTWLAAPEMRRVGPEALASIGRLTRLAFLNLELCMASGGYAALASLWRLRALGLSTCAGLTERDVEALAIGLSDLRAADFAFTRVGDIGCAALARCTALTSLSLESCPVTDAGLVALQALPALATLNLQTCSRVPLGVGALGSMRRLRTVGLCRLQGWASQLELDRHLDDGRSDAVEAMLPGCTVEREPMGYSIHDFFSPESGADDDDDASARTKPYSLTTAAM